MANPTIWACRLLFCMLLIHGGLCIQGMELNITVPETYEITSTDEYVCTIVALPEQPSKLVGVVPLADQAVVHHMLLFGCQEPAKQPKSGEVIAWNCAHHGVCGTGGSEILYGWGRNAPGLDLVPGVGFSVGKGTSIRYIVAQVHFKDVRKVDGRSGVTLKLKPEATPYAAGVITFASMFSIPPNTPLTKVPQECCYLGHQPLTTFAFRVHTHALGRSVYMTRPTWAHPDVIETVAVNDPQLPQAFYPVKQQVIWPGDKLKVTCEFNSTGRFRVTNAGATSEDEMCNMYMMVYAPHPFIAMCNGDVMNTDEGMPGTMPTAGSLVEDPCPFWQPPGKASAAKGVQPKVNDNDGLGDASGVAVGGDGSVWALHRGDHHWDYNTFNGKYEVNSKELIKAPVIAELDPATGHVVKRMGGNLLSMPHMITLDHDHSVWVVDVGLHQVLKLNQEGEVLLSVGTKMTPGSGKDKLCEPTHVAVARDGSFWVADGYCNSRVVHFSANGTYLGEVPIPVPANRGPSAVVHSLVLDECRNRLFVANREAGQVLVVSIQHKMVTETKNLMSVGKVWSITMGPYGEPLVLCWQEGKDARLVSLIKPDTRSWAIPGTAQQAVHQMALGAAPQVLSGAADRMFALYVASTCCGPVQRFILVPPGVKLPDASALVLPPASPTTAPPPVDPATEERAEEKQEEEEEELEKEEELEEELEEEAEEEQVEEMKEELEEELDYEEPDSAEQAEILLEEKELDDELAARKKEREAARKEREAARKAKKDKRKTQPKTDGDSKDSKETVDKGGSESGQAKGEAGKDSGTGQDGKGGGSQGSGESGDGSKDDKPDYEEADEDEDEEGDTKLSAYDSKTPAPASDKAAAQGGDKPAAPASDKAAAPAGDQQAKADQAEQQQSEEGDDVEGGSHVGARERVPTQPANKAESDAAPKSAPASTPGASLSPPTGKRRPGKKRKHRTHADGPVQKHKQHSDHSAQSHMSAEQLDHVIGADVNEGWVDSGSDWRGSTGARLLAFIVFAAVMAGVMFLVSRKLVRKWYGEPDTQHQQQPQVGRGVKYQKASIDEMLARSAELDALEDGSMGQQFHNRVASSANSDKAPLLSTQMAVISSKE